MQESAADPHRVLVRLQNGERVELATLPDRASAEARARELIRQLDADPTAWPEVGRRFLRPGAIVSIDIVGRSPAI